MEISEQTISKLERSNYIGIKNQETFVNKNTHLSREQVIVLIRVSNEQGINLLPEFVFTGTNKRPPQINALARIKYQEVTKGSY